MHCTGSLTLALAAPALSKRGNGGSTSPLPREYSAPSAAAPQGAGRNKTETITRIPTRKGKTFLVCSYWFGSNEAVIHQISKPNVGWLREGSIGESTALTWRGSPPPPESAAPCHWRAAGEMIRRLSILTRELAMRLAPMRWTGAIPLPLCGGQFERTLRDCLKNVRVHRRPHVALQHERRKTGILLAQQRRAESLDPRTRAIWDRLNRSQSPDRRTRFLGDLPAGAWVSALVQRLALRPAPRRVRRLISAVEKQLFDWLPGSACALVF